MNRSAVIASGIAALACAGVAIAGAVATNAVQPVTAALAVNGGVQATLQGCAAKLDARGTATSSNTALQGPARLQLTGKIDSDANAGTFYGTLRIDVASGPDTLASFSGVYANGELHGLLTGRRSQTSRAALLQPFDRLMANLSANLNPTTGQLSSIKIGATDSGGPAVFLEHGGSCSQGNSGAGGAPPSRPNP